MEWHRIKQYIFEVIKKRMIRNKKSELKDKTNICKLKNIIEMALISTAMLRVFEKRAKEKIINELNFFEEIEKFFKIKEKEEFDKLHSELCNKFSKIIKSYNKKKNKNGKQLIDTSFGQAAKVVDIVLKVCIYYCEIPGKNKSKIIAKLLNSPIDTPILEYIKNKYKKEENINAKSINEIEEETYKKIQKLIRHEIKREYYGIILPVQWDDMKWRELQNK